MTMTTDRLDQIEARLTLWPFDLTAKTCTGDPDGCCLWFEDRDGDQFPDATTPFETLEAIAHAPTDLAATSRALRAVLELAASVQHADEPDPLVWGSDIIRAITTALEGNRP